MLGLISNVSKVAGGLATGLAVNSFQMYLGMYFINGSQHKLDLQLLYKHTHIPKGPFFRV